MLAKIAIGILGTFVTLAVIGKLIPAKPKPELIIEETVGRKGQDAAIAVAKAASASRYDPAEFPEWERQEGCALAPAGTYFMLIEKEAGHADVTKVSIGGGEMYLLWLHRPPFLETQNNLAESLNLQQTPPMGGIPPRLLSHQPEREE